MTAHWNADSSVSDGVKVEAPGALVSQPIGLDVTASAQLTVPATAVQAIVQADGGDVRFRLDGTVPTGAAGFLIKNGTSITLSAADAIAAKFIQASGATSLLNAWFTL